MITPLTASTPLAATGTTTPPPTPNQTANTAEATFMNLLVTELKSQDPTSPMDPTAMVGQMLSMNQLNELISINQTLQNATGTTTPPASSTHTSSSAVSNSLTGVN